LPRRGAVRPVGRHRRPLSPPRRRRRDDRRRGARPDLMGAPAYTRLENDERRRRLLELGARLFTEHAYDEISMSRIAREAGISKALLYNSFASKQEYFTPAPAGAAEELRPRLEPDPALPPAQALTDALDAYLAWIEDNADA